MYEKIFDYDIENKEIYGIEHGIEYIIPHILTDEQFELFIETFMHPCDAIINEDGQMYNWTFFGPSSEKLMKELSEETQG